MQPEDYMSFLVRLWRDYSGNDHPGSWQAEVEHIQTGARCRLCTLDELLEFLRLAASAPATVQPASDQ